jgi:two-component system phosphate regulon sensor histidine kinase PhoR
MAEIDLLRRRVINVVGHELRTPVTTMRGLAEVLLTADLATIRDEVGPRLLTNLRRLERMIDDVLVGSGVTTALPVGRPAAERVAPALEAAWADLANAGDLSVGGDVDGRVLLPPGSLQRIAAHVLANVASYGEPPLVATITASPGTTRVAVASSGSTLSDQELRLAFEPFFRGEAAVMKAPGLGLGLTVVKLLVEQAGGTASLTATPSGETVTILELPAP